MRFRLAVPFLLVIAASAWALDQAPLFLQRWGTRGSNDGQFWVPWDVAVDRFGNVFVSDFSFTPGRPHRIQKFTSNGSFLLRYGTTAGSDPGQYNQPRGLAIDGDDLWVCDTGNQRLQKLTVTGLWLGEIFVGGSPYDVAVDASGNLYVADLVSQSILKLDATGVQIGGWGGPGTGPGLFQDPWSVAVAPGGDVWVVDRNNHRVQRFDANGTYLGAIGDGMPGTNPGQLTQPRGVAVDADGSVYVTDQGHRVQKFTAVGTFVWQFGSEGILNGQFEFPTGLTVERFGATAQNYYVVDQESNRVQKLGDDLTPVVPTTWGRVKDRYRK